VVVRCRDAHGNTYSLHQWRTNCVAMLPVSQLTAPDARQWQEEFGRGTRFQIFRVPLSRQYQTMEFSKVRRLVRRAALFMPSSSRFAH
jgi:hypothetical protein